MKHSNILFLQTGENDISNEAKMKAVWPTTRHICYIYYSASRWKCELYVRVLCVLTIWNSLMWIVRPDVDLFARFRYECNRWSLKRIQLFTSYWLKMISLTYLFNLWEVAKSAAVLGVYIAGQMRRPPRANNCHVPVQALPSRHGNRVVCCLHIQKPFGIFVTWTSFEVKVLAMMLLMAYMVSGAFAWCLLID